MDKKFIDLLKSQIEEGEKSLAIGENLNPEQSYTYLANKSSRWSIETENYLKYGIENQDYLTEFRACVVEDYNGNIEVVRTLHKKLGYLNSFVKLLEENYMAVC